MGKICYWLFFKQEHCREGGEEKKKKKVVAEDGLVVKYYFSCRRIVSRTTMLMMELQSEYVFPFLFYLLLISEVGRPLFVLESFAESCVTSVIFSLP